MTTGDVILVHGEGFLPRKIQGFQHLEGKPGWEWNHVGIIIGVNGMVYVSEMIGKGCVNTRWDDYLDRIDKKEISIITGTPVRELSIGEMTSVVSTAMESAGRVRYERKNLLLEQPVRILSDFITGNEVWLGAEKEKKAAKRQICGEYVCYHYHKIRNDFPEWYKSAPIDIYNSGLFNWSKKQNP